MKGKKKECDNLINCDFPKTPTKQWGTKTKSFNHHICVVKLLSSYQNFDPRKFSEYYKHISIERKLCSLNLRENVPLLASVILLKTFMVKQKGKKCFEQLWILSLLWPSFSVQVVWRGLLCSEWNKLAIRCQAASRCAASAVFAH